MDLYYSSDANIVSIVAFPPLGNSADVVSVYIDFPLNSVGDASFHCTAYDNSRDDWNGLWDHLRDWRIFGEYVITSATPIEFCEWTETGIDVYIRQCKYYVKEHLSPWF